MLAPHELCRQRQALDPWGSAGSSSSEDVRPCVGPPRCCPRHGAGGPERVSLPRGCWPGICPRYIPRLCRFSADLCRAGEKRQPLPAAGQGWRQLRHGGSLQPPCGCSLPAQPASLPAQLHPGFKLIPVQAHSSSTQARPGGIHRSRRTLVRDQALPASRGGRQPGTPSPVVLLKTQQPKTPLP